MPSTYTQEQIDQTIAFHGHFCPGLAIGIRAAELAGKQLGLEEKIDLTAVVETDMCGVDAIQYLTGCTFGKGNLIHKDYGKMAFTFFDRKTGQGFRAVLNPDMQAGIGDELRSLMKRVGSGNADHGEKARLKALRKKLQDEYMNAPLTELFTIKTTDLHTPSPARILNSLRCEDCTEMTMESRTRRFDGKTLCIPCFQKVEQKM